MANGTYVLKAGEQYQAVRKGWTYIITIHNVTVMASLLGENVTVKYDVSPTGWVGDKVALYETPWQVVEKLTRWSAVEV